MALLDSTVGLIYALKADDSDARKSVSDLRKHIDDETSKIEESSSNAFLQLGKSIGLTDEQMVSLGKAIPIAGAVAAGIAGIAAAAVATGAALFKLAQEASDFGGEIFDASEKTGLSAETLSALKYEAEKSGIAFETVTGSVSKFSKLVAEASRGSEEAKNKLTALGIDPVKAASDLEGALIQVFERIVELPPGIAQMTAAQDAFGKSGADLLPFLKDFDGDMKGLIQTAKRLGVTIDDEAAAQADDFGDTLSDLNAQVTGVSRQIGMELIPTITKMMKDMSTWLSENKQTWMRWGTEIKSILEGVRGAIAWFSTPEGQFAIYGLRVATGDRSPFIYIPPVEKPPEPEKTEEPKKTFSDEYLKDLEAEKKAAEEREKQRQEYAKKELAAQISNAQSQLKDIDDGFQKLVESLRREFDSTLNKEEFFKNYNDALRGYVAEYQSVNRLIRNLQTEQANAEQKTETERKNIADQWLDRETKTAEKLAEIKNQSDKYITDALKKNEDDRIKFTENAAEIAINANKRETDIKLNDLELAFKKMQITEETYIRESQAARLAQLLYERDYLLLLTQTEKVKEKIAEIDAKLIFSKDKNGKETAILRETEKEWLEYYDKVLDREIEKTARKLEIEQKIAEAKERQQQALTTRPGYDENGNETTKAPEDNSIFGAWKASWDEFKTALEQDSVGIGNIVTQMAKLFQDAFYGMANALANAVENWVLYGESIGKALKKALAAELAHIAGVATVKALYATALGFLRLAEWDFAGAGNAFLSAGLWAALAGGTALAARALAGNQNVQTSFSGATRANTATNAVSSGSTNGGRAYSSSGDQVTTITNDRNQPQGRIKISLERGLIAEVIREDINSNGPIRRDLIDVFQGA